MSDCNFYYIWPNDANNMITLSGEKKYKVILIHVASWVAYVLLQVLQRVGRNPGSPVNLLDIVFTILPGVYVFYGSIFVFRFLSAKKYILFAVTIFLFYCSYFAVAYVNAFWISPLFIPGLMTPPFNTTEMIAASLWVFFNYSAFGFGYYFAYQAVKRQQQLRLAEKQQMEARQETLMAEYAFLRSQINPHFLHNTLNFFYARSLGTSPELSEAILTLSEIMRYSLEKDEDNTGNVPLTKEVENLQKVIKINELRFNNRLNIDFSVSGNIGSVRIIPLVLITLVENAFKHGDLINPRDPVRIALQVEENGGRFRFRIRNLKKTGPRELGHGIGMDNIRRRLDYAYQKDYDLIITDEDHHYSVELTIRFQMNQQAINH